METSRDCSLHFLAKKAKSRLIGNFDGAKQKCTAKQTRAYSETYNVVVEMIVSNEKVYDPLARIIGKDLTAIPDSVDKQRMVLRASNEYHDAIKKLRGESVKAVREGKPFIFEGKEFEPNDILSKIR